MVARDGYVYISDIGNIRVRVVSPDGIIRTFAGGGFLSDGEGISATAALLVPAGLAMDRAGNLYICDVLNRSRIRRVGSDGRISTVAGSDAGFTDGFATIAKFNSPFALALDSSGNLFVSDRSNLRIRRINPAGVVDTVAGTGEYRPSFSGIRATETPLRNPAGPIVDRQGNVYFVERTGQRIRKISPDGILTTVAGTSVAGYNGDNIRAVEARVNDPLDIAWDETTGALDFSDAFNLRIRRISPEGVISTVAGNGTLGQITSGLATNAAVTIPDGVAFDREGNLYICDTGNHVVRKVDRAGTVTTVAGRANALGIGIIGYSGDNGPATRATLSGPAGVAIDASGNIYIADRGNYRVRKVDRQGNITTVAGNGEPTFSGDGGPATRAGLSCNKIAVDNRGNLFIADHLNQRIRKVAADTGRIETVAGNVITGFSGDGGPALAASLNDPSGVAVDSEGNLYIADTNNNRIRVIYTVPLNFDVSPSTLSFRGASTGAPTEPKKLAIQG